MTTHAEKFREALAGTKLEQFLPPDEGEDDLIQNEIFLGTTSESSQLEFEPSVIYCAQSLTNLLGKDRAIGLLEDQVSPPYGYGRSQGAIQAAINGVKGGLGADEFRVWSSACNLLLSASRARDHFSRVKQVLDVFDAGIITDRKPFEAPAEPPKPPLGESPIQNWYGFNDWKRDVLRPWHEELSLEQKGRIDLISLEQAIRREFEGDVKRAVISLMVGADSAEKAKNLFDTYESTFGKDTQFTKAFRESPHAWKIALDRFDDRSNVSLLNSPNDEILHKMETRLLIDGASRYMNRENSALPWAQAELLRRYPTPADHVYVLPGGRVLEPSGGILERKPSWAANVQIYEAEFHDRLFSTVPNDGGWFDIEREKVFSGEIYSALERLQKVSKGSLLVAPALLDSFCRHETKAYPRLLPTFGRGRSFDLPIWRPMDGEGALTEQLTDIQTVRKAGLPVPEKAYWLDARLGETKNGKPRLEPTGDPSGTEPAALVLLSYNAESNGRWGWSGETPSARKGSEKGGAQILFNNFWSSNGGGLHATMIVAWIPKGGQIGLDNGMSCIFDGETVERVKGGDLATEEDPSRN